MTTLKTAAIFGGTGEVGRQVLAALQLTTDKHFCAIHDFRRTLPPSTASQDEPVSHKIVALNFDNLLAGAEEEIKQVKSIEADIVFITLGNVLPGLSLRRDLGLMIRLGMEGTTKATAGSAEAFIKIDKDYVLAAARAARVNYPFDEWSKSN